MISLIILLMLAPPDTLTIEQCYRLAESNHPLQRELPLIDGISALEQETLDARFLPEVSLRSQAIYQSDVPALPISLPGVTSPTISKDQYKASLNVNTLLYDGGLTSLQRDLQHLQHDLSREEINVQLYQLRQQIDAAYFGVLLQDARLSSLEVFADDLRARHEQVLAAVRAGIMLPGNADVLEVERIKIEQQQLEAGADRRTALAVLSRLIGEPLDADVTLSAPDPPTGPSSSGERLRPEYDVFDTTKSLLAEREALAARKNRPRLIGFAEAAYGRPPGLDFFNDSFRPYYSLGVQMQWPVWDWRATTRERQSLALQRERVQAQEEAFSLGISIAAQKSLDDFERLEALLERDDEIILLRERIAAQAASQLEAGVITATEYLIEGNAAHQARLARTLHEIQLAFAHTQYATTVGIP